MKGIKQIKNYRLIRQVGKGATGIVYEAINDDNNKKYAIKAIPQKFLENGRAMDNLKRELKLLHGLNHNNIIKITGLEKTANNVYLVLEYCNGGNLYEYSYFYKSHFKTPLPEEDVQKILRQLIKGLEYMHNSKIVHRDIKLENILINFNNVPNTVKKGEEHLTQLDYKKVKLENFTIKIADLGYARDLGVNEVANTICGTPITMAPDIVNLFNNNKKDQKYNSKVDLWSLGTIAYELLVGSPPFYAKNYKELFEVVMNGVYNLPKSLRISIEAITFINGLLQFYPEKRFDWDTIKRHPFILNDVKDFNFIDLRTIENGSFSTPEQLQVDTKDCNNFVWLMYEAVNNLPIDRINEPDAVENNCDESYEELNIGNPMEHENINKPEIKGSDNNDFIPDGYNKVSNQDVKPTIQENRASKCINREIFNIKLSPDKVIKKEEQKKSVDELIVKKIIERESLSKNDEYKFILINRFIEIIDNKMELPKRKEIFNTFESNKDDKAVFDSAFTYVNLLPKGIKLINLADENVEENNSPKIVASNNGDVNMEEEDYQEYLNKNSEDWDIVSTTSLTEEDLVNTEIFESIHIINDHIK
jgi:serine/threonine protein kinase